MDYRVVYTESAQEDFSALEDSVARGVLKKVRFYVETGKPMSYAKKLKGLADYFRFRVGDYRVIFRKDQKSGRLVVLVVLKIGHRKSVYKGRLL